MAIDFYLADTLKEASKCKEHLHFSEKVQDYLHMKFKESYPESVIICDLDPYGDKLFDKEGILKIINACEKMKDRIESNKESKEFCKKMIEFCHMAIQNNKKIYAVGD